MSSVPADLLYSSEHEWVGGDAEPGSVVTIGITEHAADALGDVVYVELPSVGDPVTAGEVCGELESSKAVSELYSPRHRHGDRSQRGSAPRPWSHQHGALRGRMDLQGRGERGV